MNIKSSVVAIYDTHDKAEAAIRELQKSGFTIIAGKENQGGLSLLQLGQNRAVVVLPGSKSIEENNPHARLLLQQTPGLVGETFGIG